MPQLGIIVASLVEQADAIFRLALCGTVEQRLDLCPAFRSQGRNLSAFHLVVKPSLGHSQFSSHRDRRYLQSLRYLIHGEPCEIPQFDRFTFSWIEFLQRAQAAVESDQVPAALLLKTHDVGKRYSASGAFAGLFLARVIHQDLSHQSRSNTEEMRPALPAWVFLINQAHIRLVDDRRGLQSVALAFPPQAACGKLVELLVHQRGKVFERLVVPLPPLGQQSCHIVGSRHGLPIDNAELLAALYTDSSAAEFPLGNQVAQQNYTFVIDFTPSLRMGT